MDSTTFLSRYQLTRDQEGNPVALQRGPGGVTYRAEDIESDQPVAVKLVPSYSFAPDGLQQLEKEARAAQQVSHPNVARLYDFGIQGGDVVFVTEILEGSTLDSWVEEHGPLPPAAVVRVALQVVAGLAAAAFHSVGHQSIQPATLMIVPGQTPDGEWPLVKILNFGGGPTAVSASEFSAGHTGRSAAFASPEQLKGYPVDFRSEIYSLGCTMWFLLTGAPPVPGTSDKSAVVPRALRPILAQMVALDPMARPQDPVALQDQLRDSLNGLERRESVGRKFGLPAAAISPADPAGAAPKPMQLLKPIALAAAVLLLVGVGALALPYVLHSRSAASEQIGVPVGIPDQAADAAPASRSSAAAAPPGASPIVAAASVAPSAEPEQALVSVEPPRPGQSPAADQPPMVAANDNNSTTTATADSVNSPEQAATPGPDNESAERLQRTRTAQAEQTPSENMVAAAEASPPPRAPVARTTPKPSSTVARANQVRRAEPADDIDVNAPAAPRGAKRAKYLGTTPEGDLVFGLPSDQRGYVTPPAADGRRTRRARRPTVEPAPEMVLPAEPVDPDEGD